MQASEDGPAEHDRRAAMPAGAADLLRECLLRMDEGLLLFDAQARLVLASDAAASLLRLPAECLRQGTPLAELCREMAQRGLLGEGDPAVLAASWSRDLGDAAQARGRTAAPAGGPVLSFAARALGEQGFLVRVTGGGACGHGSDGAGQAADGPQLHAIVDAMPVPIVIQSDGRIVCANPRAAAMFGQDRSTLIGQSVDSLCEDAADHGWLARGLAEADGVRDRELRLRRDDGEPFWAAVSASPAAYRERPAVILTCHDVTERKRAESAMRQTEWRLRQQVRTLGNLSARLVADETDLEAALQAVVARAAQTLFVDRVALWRLDEASDQFACVDAYRVDQDRHYAIPPVPRRELGGFIDRLQDEHVIAVNDLALEESWSERFRANLLHSRARAQLVPAIRREGRYYGHLTLTHYDSPRIWTSEERSLAAAFAEFISGTLETFARRDAEQELARNEARFRALIENATDIIAVLDAEGRVSFISPAVERLLGRKASELVGQLPIDLVHRDDREQVAEAMRRGFAEDGKVRMVQLRVRGRGDDWRTVEANWLNLLADPNVAGIIVTARDITERRQQEQAVERQRQQLQAIIDSLPLSVSVKDSAGRYVLVNKLFCQWADLTPDQMLGQRQETVLPQGMRPQHVSELDDAVRRNGEIMPFREFELELCKPDSESEADGWQSGGSRRERRLVLISKLPLRGGGPGIDVLTVGLDVTQRRRAELERQQLESQLHQAERMEAVGQLAGGIAHEINNMLHPIITFAQQCEKEIEDERLRRYLGIVLSSARQARDIVRNVLTFARHQRSDEDRVNVETALRPVAEAVRAHVPARISFTVDCADVGFALINDTGLSQVIMNLVSNAVDAIEDSGLIALGCRAIEIDHVDAHELAVVPGRFAEVTVTDTGAGIDPALGGRIFEPFLTSKESGKGTGLGLAVVYGIVRGWGGAITVRSAPGRGSVFAVLIPLLPS